MGLKRFLKGTSNRTFIVWPLVLFAVEATILLRRHGQEVCKTSAPRCEVCAVRGDCAFYSNLMARAQV